MSEPTIPVDAGPGNDPLQVTALQLWSRVAPVRVDGVPTVVPIIVTPEGVLALDWSNARTVGDK